MRNKLWLSDDDFKFIYSRVPRLCVDLLVVCNGKVLLKWRDIEPRPNRWHVPGGTVYMQEGLFEAGKRIGKEELGVELCNFELWGVEEYLFEKDKLGFERHSVAVGLLCEISGSVVDSLVKDGEIEMFEDPPENIIEQQLNMVVKYFNNSDGRKLA